MAIILLAIFWWASCVLLKLSFLACLEHPLVTLQNGKNFPLSTKAAWRKGKQKTNIAQEVHSKQLDTNTVPAKKIQGSIHIELLPLWSDPLSVSLRLFVAFNCMTFFWTIPKASSQPKIREMDRIPLKSLCSKEID